MFAALSDKDIEGVVDALAKDVDEWFLAGLEGAGARGLGIDAFIQRLAGSAAAAGAALASVEEALTAALAQAGSNDRVLVFGSFHTAAAALRVLQRL